MPTKKDKQCECHCHDCYECSEPQSCEHCTQELKSECEHYSNAMKSMMMRDPKAKIFSVICDRCEKRYNPNHIADANKMVSPQEKSNHKHFGKKCFDKKCGNNVTCESELLVWKGEFHKRFPAGLGELNQVELEEILENSYFDQTEDVVEFIEKLLSQKDLECQKKIEENLAKGHDGCIDLTTHYNGIDEAVKQERWRLHPYCHSGMGDAKND